MDDALRLTLDQRLYGACYIEAGTGRRIDPAVINSAIVGATALPPELLELSEEIGRTLTGRLFGD